MKLMHHIAGVGLLSCSLQAALAIPGAAQFDAIVKDFGKADLFSGVVLLAKDRKVVYFGNFGDANKDYPIANGPDTSFNIGSIGKTFTAVAIMQLVEAGQLALTDPLDKYLPSYPYPQKSTITIAHLLNHSSGLGNYMAHKDYAVKMNTLRRIDDVLPLIFEQKPEFAAGERFAYSNSGMVLLGAIIEKISGMSYDAYLRTHIFQVAGMQHSGLVQEDQMLPNRSLGYSKTLRNGYRSNVTTVPPAFSDGGLRTTAADLLKFDAALYGDKLISADIRKTMQTPVGPEPEYAFGWESKGGAAMHYVGHNGGAPGVNAELRHYDAGYTMIVLSNYSHGATEIVNQLEAVLFDKPYEPPTAALSNFGLAVDLEEQDENADALTVLDRNRALAPPHLPSLYTAARWRITQRKEPQRAIEDLDRYLQFAGADTQPPAAAAWWRKGNAFEQLANLPEAIKCYEKAAALDPKMPQPKMDLERVKAPPASPPAAAKS